MEADQFLRRLMADPRTAQQVAHVADLPERPAAYADIELSPPVREALSVRGIERLYSHQVEAIQHVRAGRNVVVVTGTASGKTICYNVPILETLVADPAATVLCIYPTKALTQDQLRGLEGLAEGVEGLHLMAGTYDGDTPQNQRRKVRDQGQVMLTNPDMLHQGVLPNHGRWGRFFTHLRYVVIDEIHAYRGVFGSHLANVTRRLRRICRHYGAEPQFVCCSATIGNPKGHAELLTGLPMAMVDRDGSPRGRKKFVLWNPPPVEPATSAGGQDLAGGERRSALWTAVELMTALVKNEIQTITFVQTRLAAELVFAYAKQQLEPISHRLAERVHAYRGGYLPEERREIERRLASGDILGVSSTNALELGIDIGSLDACILVGYPGTIASTWQRAGRAGRSASDALVFLVAQNAPIDQYLMYHSDYMFEQNPEQAVIDVDNPHVVVGHLKSALYELPLPDDGTEAFGEYASVLLELLEDEADVRHQEDKWYWASPDFPAAKVNLRNISGAVYTIQDVTEEDQVIGTMDESSAMCQVHDHAVYLHGAETYFVNHLDMEKKIAFVERKELDYYTQAVQSSQLQLDETEEEEAWRDCTVGFGDVTVVTHIPMFKKVKFHSRDSLGFEQLEMPPQQLETVSLWLVPPAHMADKVHAHNRVFAEGLIGVANVLVEVAPMFVMCDVQDIGVVVDANNLGRDAIFLYDRYPGGMGYAERCTEIVGDLIESVHTVISRCRCEDGCPSCVGAAVPSFALSDLDSGTRGRIPDKEAALIILHEFLGLPPYQPKRPSRHLRPEARGQASAEPSSDEDLADDDKSARLSNRLRKKLRGR